MEQTTHHYGTHNDYTKHVSNRCSWICHIPGIILHVVEGVGLHVPMYVCMCIGVNL